MNPSDIQEIMLAVKALGSDLDQVGLITWVGLVSGIVGSVRIWTMDPTQKFMQGIALRVPALSWLYWGNFKPWAKFLIPFLLAFGGSVVTGLISGLSWGAILVTAIGAAIASIGTHHGTKWAGSKIGDHANARVNAGIRLVLPKSISQAPLLKPQK